MFSGSILPLDVITAPITSSLVSDVNSLKKIFPKLPSTFDPRSAVSCLSAFTEVSSVGFEVTDAPQFS